MTTTPVHSITDEQIAEIEDYCAGKHAEGFAMAHNLALTHILAIITRLREAEKDAAPQWIPVSERMPEENKSVLVFCENNGPDFDVMWHHNGFWFDNSDQFYVACAFYAPTHWMPLPNPPTAMQGDK